jgi:hypothetical protein
MCKSILLHRHMHGYYYFKILQENEIEDQLRAKLPRSVSTSRSLLLDV